VAVIVISLILDYFEKPKIDAHFSNLRQDRKELSICNFAREFDTKLVDTWVIWATYEEVQRIMCIDEPLPLKPSDHLFETLKLDDDDLDLDLIEIISQRTNRTLDNYKINPFFGKVTTVRNLVLFLNNQPVKSAI